MIRKVSLVVLLLVAGVAIAFYLRDGHAPEDGPAFAPRAGASAEVRIADLERALAAQIDRGRTLEARVAQLEGRLGAPADASRQAGPRAVVGDDERAALIAGLRERFGADGPIDPAAMRERMRERQLERLVAAGFTRERAEWLERRTQELEVQAMQAQYEAQRGGQPAPGQADTQRALRNEIGDAEYERYLTATGRPTQVQVLDVLASSAAERAGLQSGDQIVSYAGMRVFDIRELNALTREGAPGESVTVTVLRNGQSMQLQVPRGPLGVSGGAMRGQPGGPGDFRGRR
jgi:hypothetical protein